jgi:hypothetical protein
MDIPSYRNPWVRRLFPPLTSLRTAPMPAHAPVSVVIPARDEQRCIARCLDSVVGRGFDDILVMDTGSTDRTVDIVTGYRRRGVRLVRMSWPDSFAEVRNTAIAAVATGWIVFLDADEWLAERSADQLAACLTSLNEVADLDRLVFAPLIHHVDRNTVSDDVPRILKADSGIRYRGRVHEYPVLPGDDAGPVPMAGLDIVFHHDGYDRAVTDAKDKRHRNLGLLCAARREEPDNARWLYFTIRDGLPALNRTQLIDACTTLRTLAERDVATGDRRTSRQYYRMALGEACQGLAAMGEWTAMLRYCDELDRLDQRDSPDTCYLRTVAELLHGVVTDRDLLRVIRIRRDATAMSASAIDTSGRHLDAVITALLSRVRNAADADRYLALCAPWTDTFFESSRLRDPQPHTYA